MPRFLLQRSATAVAASNAKFVARKQVDLSKKGLRTCKQETTVLQFRVCGHCKRTRYCCPEHAKLHWKAHKREYEEEEEEEEGEASGGGGSAEA
jgi:hypothetical protein